MFYAGIGSRTTPPGIQAKMTDFARRLEKLGYTLRSGGAVGADKAFEDGVTDENKKEIFTIKDSTPEAEAKAEKIHPAWFRCNWHARKLHGRNCQIVLGKCLTRPVSFVCCWTPLTAELGGTRTGIVAAIQEKIEVYNFASEKQLEAFEKFLAELETTT